MLSCHFLVTMPNKFRKNVWVKRGDFIVVEPIEEGDKVKAEICKILTAEHIKEYNRAGIWPERFPLKSNKENYQTNNEGSNATTGDNDDSTSEDDDLEPNMNRPVARIVQEDSDDSESDEDDTSSDQDD